jgi:hypothetical protein
MWLDKDNWIIHRLSSYVIILQANSVSNKKSTHLFLICVFLVSLDSVVDYWLDRSIDGGSISGRGKRFFPLQSVQTTCGAQPTPYPICNGSWSWLITSTYSSLIQPVFRGQHIARNTTAMLLVVTFQMRTWLLTLSLANLQTEGQSSFENLRAVYLCRHTLN